jgi:hypothetical protein
MSQVLRFVDRPRPSPTPKLVPPADVRRAMRVLNDSVQLLAVHRPHAVKTMAMWAVRLAAPIQAGTWNPDTTKGGV